MSDTVTNQDLLNLWAEVRTLVEAVDADVAKNARGVAAAGVRARKGFRLLRKKLVDTTKCSLTTGKKDE